MNLRDSDDALEFTSYYISIVNGSTKLIEFVQCPCDMNLNDWIFLNLKNFFIHINLLYGTVVEFCTDETCPTMSAGPTYEYKWTDESTQKQLCLSAPKYIEILMESIESKFDSFTDSSDFHFAAQLISKQIFSVYAHIYHHHFHQIIALGQEPHINTSLKHFILFSNVFNLINDGELSPLKELLSILV